MNDKEKETVLYTALCTHCETAYKARLPKDLPYEELYATLKSGCGCDIAYT